MVLYLFLYSLYSQVIYFFEVMFLFNVDHFCDFNIDFNIDFLLNICPYVGLSFLFLISLNDMEVISFLFFIDST